MPRIVHCVKLGREAEGLDVPPYPGKLGRRIHERVSKEAWLAWLEQQKQLINDKRLNLADPQARKHLAEQMERHFFGAEPATSRARLPLVRCGHFRTWGTHCCGMAAAPIRERLLAAEHTQVRRRGWRSASAVALAVLYLGSGLFTVQPGEVGVGTRFGQNRLAGARAGTALPPAVALRLAPRHSQGPGAARRVQPGRARAGAGGSGPAEPHRLGPGAGARKPANTWFQKEAAPDELFLLTGDGHLIDLRWAVQYRIADAVAYAFNVAEPERLRAQREPGGAAQRGRPHRHR